MRQEETTKKINQDSIWVYDIILIQKHGAVLKIVFSGRGEVNIDNKERESQEDGWNRFIKFVCMGLCLHRPKESICG